MSSTTTTTTRTTSRTIVWDPTTTPAESTTTSATPPPPPQFSPSHPVPQVLAPVGGRAQFLAALNAGADQVFLGLKAFNARARAENFEVDDLRELVPLAKKYGMQVLVTVNVLVKENELGALIDTLAALEELEVDAIIVQDQAVGAIVQEFFPTLRLHASTQMAVHNLPGVVKAAALGFRRVVLARELTAKEMKDIRSGVPSEVVQLEAFVHGSLCYSYSGLCFFSGETDARSGNRGECAYTCRQPYQLTSEDGMGFLFSMSDLDTSHDLDLLVEAGVDTFKIEGRKKDAQYVAGSVSLYRRRLDELYGQPTLRPEAPPEAVRTVGTAARRGEASLRKDLSLSFHRGTTSFFVKGRYHENVIDLNNAGHLGVPAGRVQSVAKDGRSFRFVPEVDLEKYDGLKVVPPSRAFHSMPQHGAQQKGDAADSMGRLLRDKYENDLPEFSLRQFKVGGSKAFEASAGATVDVEVPIELRRIWEQTPDRMRPIQAGDLVFQSRSNELKRRVEALAVVPEGYKAKEWDLVDVRVDVTKATTAEEGEGGLTLSVTVSKLGQTLVQDAWTWPSFEYSTKKTKEDVVGDIAELLGTYGDLGFRAPTVVISGLDNDNDDDDERVPFIPRKDLKALKQRVATQLGGAYSTMINERKQRAKKALGLVSSSSSSSSSSSKPTPLPSRDWTDRRFVLKFDRPEYLDLLDEYFGEVVGPREEMKGLIEEICFEPKRMYLADTKPEEGVARLLAFGKKHGVRVRLALPTVIRAWDMTPLKGWVQAFSTQQEQQQQQQQQHKICFEVGNLGAWGLLEEWGLLSSSSSGSSGSSSSSSSSSSSDETQEKVDVSTDFTLYALNSQASAVWARVLDASHIALSVEDDAANLRAHMKAWVGPARPQYILHKDVPLFMAEACSLTALHGNKCPGSKVCGYRTLSIENQAGEKFEVAHEHCKSIVYSTNSQSLVHRQQDLLAMGIRDFRLDFLTRNYTRNQLFDVLDGALRRDPHDVRPLPNTHVANFDRTLL